MKFDKFMELYKDKNEEDKIDFLKEHINRSYVPYEEKVSMANAICESCYKKKDGNSERFFADSTARYMLTCMAIIDLYTDIERDSSSILHDFNVFNEFGVFDVIGELINQRDLREFRMVINLVCNDMITNEYEIKGFISRQVERFSELIATTLPPFLDKLSEQLDTDVIREIINKEG